MVGTTRDLPTPGRAPAEKRGIVGHAAGTGPPQAIKGVRHVFARVGTRAGIAETAIAVSFGARGFR